jgi:hypothetical protein
MVVREASRTATTSGIGPNSVLYPALRDMLLAYPAHGVKAAIMRRKATDLVWVSNKTTVEIHSIVMEYYEAYDRVVAQTQAMADVTMIVPAQDWVTRFTEMQGMFPPWALALITNFPDRFNNMANVCRCRRPACPVGIFLYIIIKQDSPIDCSSSQQSSSFLECCYSAARPRPVSTHCVQPRRGRGERRGHGVA